MASDRSFLDLARELADLRKAHATEFLLQRVWSKTDAQAKAAADEKYIHDLTMAEARYEIARHITAKSIQGSKLSEVRRQIEESYDHPHPDPDQESVSPATDPEGPDKDCAD